MPLDQYGTGRCINCGFLGQRSKGCHDTECLGVSEEQRLHGHITLEGFFEVIPCCFIGKYDLSKELGGTSWQKPKYREKVSEVIAKDRNCEEWYLWKEFLDPKTHYEELKMRQLEESRKQFEERMEENRREWQKWMSEQAERDRKQSDKMMLRWTILGIILSALLAIMQLVGAFWAQALFRD
jgi:hypothetical protein